ncbi:MAG: AAA family ATPase [Bacteroides sp.]|nr:AAA family ATPase [Bacteroides sp.]
MVDNILFAAMQQQLALVPIHFHRYLYHELPDARLIGVIGPRGVDKSTLILQKIKQSSEKSLSVDADNLYFTTHCLVDLANSFVKGGDKVLAIDKIHKYEGWSCELKQLH